MKPTRSILRCAVAAALAICGAGSPIAAAAASPEYEAKAVFLFHFAQLVEWPEQAFAQPDSPFVIGILGQDPFGSVLDEKARGETIHNRRILVKRFRRPEDLAACHVLFICRSEQNRLPQILSRLGGASTLTVAETDQFVRGGGMVRLKWLEPKVRFDVGPRAAEKAGLRIKADLLELADQVSQEESGKEAR